MTAKVEVVDGMSVVRGIPLAEEPGIGALTLAGLDDFAAGIAGFRVEHSWTYADPFPRMMPILAMASRIGVVRRHVAPLLILGSFAPTL